MADRRVAFRRIHGHIVPIKIKEYGKSAAEVGAGVGVSSVASYGSARLMHASAQAEDVARAIGRQAKDALEVGKRMNGPVREGLLSRAAKLTNQASQSALKSKKLQASAFRLRAGGALIGGAIIAHGVHRALSQTDIKDDAKAKAAIAAGSAAAGEFVMWNSFLRGMGNKGKFGSKIAPPFKTGFATLKTAIRRVITKGV
jgi:hypothetical protein